MAPSLSRERERRFRRRTVRVLVDFQVSTGIHCKYATTLGEIVREPGERELVLFDDRGQLHAGGILVLRVGIGLAE